MTNIGTLYIVPTPIGNLNDISQRALDILASVDLIACEDTRHTSRLLNHYDITTKTISLHDHNEAARSGYLVDKIKQGASIALVSDAGTPLISDPGYVFVKACRSEQINVIALPGPCALTTALSGSGLATDKFAFFGFLPVKQQAKSQALSTLVQKGCTSIFYEAPRRIRDTLAVCAEVFDEHHEIVLAKEISKTFETYKVGKASEILEWLDEDPVHQKGEFVLMIHLSKREQDDEFVPQAIALLVALKKELPLKRAAAIVAEHYDVKKNALYKYALENLN